YGWCRVFCGRFYPIVERQKQVCSVECDTSITVCNDCCFDTLCFDDGFSGRNSPDARLFRTSTAYGGGLSAVVCSVMGLSDMDNGVAVRHSSGRCSKAGYVVQPDYSCNQCGARLAVYLSFWLGSHGSGICHFHQHHGRRTGGDGLSAVLCSAFALTTTQ